MLESVAVGSSPNFNVAVLMVLISLVSKSKVQFTKDTTIFAPVLPLSVTSKLLLKVQSINLKFLLPTLTGQSKIIFL